MKLRARLNKISIVLNISLPDDEVTVLSVKRHVGELLRMTNSSFNISLNGCDLLDEASSLSSLGIVSGDLIHVLPTAADPSVEMADPVSHESKRPSLLGADGFEQSPKKGSLLCETAAGDEDEATGSSDVAMADGGGEVNRYLTEPMLVRDATRTAVPGGLACLCAHTPLASTQDALCAVLHVLMLESAFRAQSASSPAAMPTGWKLKSSYKLHYTHPHFTDATYQVTCVPLAGKMIIHGKVKNGEDELHCQLQLQISEFVPQLFEDPCSMYRNMAKLSRVFKDSISHFLLQNSSSEDDAVMVPSLGNLLPECKLLVLHHLDAVSLLRVSCVCSQLHDIASAPLLWRRLYLRDFGRRRTMDESLSQDWLKLYKDAYLLRRQQRLQHGQATVPNPFGGRFGPHNPFAPVPTHPPGFIGGEYDWRPPDGGLGWDPFRPRGPFGPGRGRGPYDNRPFPGPRFL